MIFTGWDDNGDENERPKKVTDWDVSGTIESTKEPSAEVLAEYANDPSCVVGYVKLEDMKWYAIEDKTTYKKVLI
jgi:hypothetical protein